MRRPVLAWVAAGIAVAATLLGVAISLRSAGPFEPEGLLYVAALLITPIVGAVIVARVPGNRVGNLLLLMGLLGGTANLADEWARANPPLPGTQWAALYAQFGFLGWVVPLIFVLLLFPDGHLLSRRWRFAAWIAGAAGAGLTLGSMLAPTFPDFPDVPNPIGIEGLGDLLALLNGGWFLLLASFALSATSLVLRYRRSRGEARVQLRWLAFAGALLGIGFVLTAIGFDADPNDLGSRLLGLPFALGLVLFPVAIGFAITRYHLYDIDVVINRTVVYAALAVFITVVYVAIGVGVGALIGGSGGDPNPGLSIAATALVAVAFQPVRERVQRFANRLVYGPRATPYEVMADFGGRMAGTLELDLALPELAEAAGAGVRASAARVRMSLPGGGEDSATWPEGASPEAWERTVEVRYLGEPIGEIAVAKEAGDPLLPAERALLDDLARQAGPALHNVRLAEELQSRLDELAEQAEQLEVSRRRLITARDAQRRSLERDIREGPRKELEHIAEALERAAGVAPHEPASAVATVDEVAERAKATLEGLRDLARGIFPPLLADQGIVPALEAHIRKVGANATLDAATAVRGARFDADIEACAYFVCLQALQNVQRHAANAPTLVRLWSEDVRLTFEVADRGPGFDASTTEGGMGLQIMRDRVDALEGELIVRSSPGEGTVVQGRVPARALEGVAP
jgi:signal transduction histidine kinase